MAAWEHMLDVWEQFCDIMSIKINKAPKEILSLYYLQKEDSKVLGHSSQQQAPAAWTSRQEGQGP